MAACSLGEQLKYMLFAHLPMSPPLMHMHKNRNSLKSCILVFFLQLIALWGCFDPINYLALKSQDLKTCSLAYLAHVLKDFFCNKKSKETALGDFPRMKTFAHKSGRAL